ncbi:MAG TPA: hypothetical protein VGL35_08325 [Rhizomicrobium sp.]|jgi:hypothetical protein
MNEESAPSDRREDIHPLAAAIALGGSETLDPRAAAYLERQSRLAELQIEELEQDLKLRHWSLRFRNVSAVMKVAFEMAIAFIFLAIAAGIAVALWTAARDDSLVIESFSVPPDLAARGLTGQAVAAAIEDKLSQLQQETESARPADTYAHSWGNDIKVQIPDAGISLGEAYRLLTNLLGHQTYISGEVYRAESGIVIATHAGADGSAAISGKEQDLDALLQRAAEAIYARTQPYRYAIYADSHGRPVEAKAVVEKLSVDGPTPEERAWAFIGLSNIEPTLEADADDDRRALAILPDFAIGWLDLAADINGPLGRDEAALAEIRRALELLEHGGRQLTHRMQAISIPVLHAVIDTSKGDFSSALEESRTAAALPDWEGWAEGARGAAVTALANARDLSGAKRAFATLPEAAGNFAANARAGILLQIAWQARDLKAFRGAQKIFDDTLSKLREKYFRGAYSSLLYDIPAALDRTSNSPELADLLAGAGDFRHAHAAIDGTPLDCVLCLRMRGRIEAAEKRWSAAAWWFADAVAHAPDLPMAYTDWGMMLLHKADYEAAIAKFAVAHEKGPHFADPLELWGEALMQKNRSDRALAKFAEANKYAPNWGRLHLEWGRALLYSGNRGAAKKQFAIASQLDLSAADAAVLSRWRAKHA